MLFLFSRGMIKGEVAEVYREFKSLVEKKKLFREGEKLVLGVSGGADSLALLELMWRLSQDLSLDLYVAHLNHGIRGPEACRDANFVQEVAEKKGLPFFLQEVSVPAYSEKEGLSVEDAARKLRYSFLEEKAWQLGATKVAVGHHRDDQVETILLNLLRGAGLDGLSGMEEIRPLGQRGLLLVRPLLSFSRQQIEDFCRRERISYVTDSTNLDPSYARNKVRLKLLPWLEKEFNPKIRENLAGMGDLLRQEREVLEEMAGKVYQESLFEGKPDLLSFHIDRLFQRGELLAFRALRQGLRFLRGGVPRNMGQLHFQSISRLCQSPFPHGELHLPGGLLARRSYKLLLLTGAAGRAPRKGPEGEEKELELEQELKVPGDNYLPFASGKGRRVWLKTELVDIFSVPPPPHQRREVFLDWDKLKEKPLKARFRRRGDRFYPLNSPGSTKLKDFLINRKVPLAERDRLVLVLAGEEIIWAAGLEIAHPYRLTSGTRRALRLLYHISEE